MLQAAVYPVLRALVAVLPDAVAAHVGVLVPGTLAVLKVWCVGVGGGGGLCRPRAGIWLRAAADQVGAAW